MDDGFEREILQAITEKLLIKKQEIVLHLQGKVDDPLKTANDIVRSLLAKNLISYILIYLKY